MSIEKTAVKRAALIGSGVIGAGWAARFVLNGIDAVIYDPSGDSKARAKHILDMARTAWAALMPGVLPEEGTLSFVDSLEDAVRDVDFVQESLPEIEDLKCTVLAKVDAILPPHVLIGSSTSGLLPSRLQAGLKHPERFVVGHPFNPVYLLPLVEVCGGDLTSAATKESAATFYRSIGMQVLHVRKEVDGFIADRLLEALWREGLWLIEEGVATTSELDDAIRYGAGLRWSFMGTFLTYRLAGGDAGMRHFLSQFGPALKLPWTKLVAPELTDELTDRIAAQSDEQAGDVSVRELEVLRDEALVKVISALSSVGAKGYASGRTLKDFSTWLRTEEDAKTVQVEPWFVSWKEGVSPEWIDYNGHMTEHRYLQVFGEATDGVLALIGAGEDYVRSGYSFYTVETHIRHLGQAYSGMALEVRSRVLDSDAKRLHLFHTMTVRGSDDPIATAEHMLLHVDSAKGKSCQILAAVQNQIERIQKLQAGNPVPEAAGRSIGIRRAA
ncbi:3-hydroxyacyl-CoA dehydrogenase [Acetobacter estunensis NRIC 0472]|uniref:L-carnitine dehydrogenase n=1 Tax=Acetobacter estunensis TaxID=104097 RepID=A0A967EJJ5_9PROT|nr:carnitine 3-dehydrogenase [Acetobacter estunensis]NHO55299.1 carnitine 3-dehydrogenase [Acetobacter estunensis]GBQ28059.1 3-hydroxyacyl-CoA dehydrogenase [Acetobacter estunensis NRIC 0472]